MLEHLHIDVRELLDVKASFAGFEFSELGEEVFVVGMGNRVELWSEENWQSHKTFSGDKSRITLSPKGARRV